MGGLQVLSIAGARKRYAAPLTKPETELPFILAVLRVLYTNDLLDSIDELAK